MKFSFDTIAKLNANQTPEVLTLTEFDMDAAAEIRFFSELQQALKFNTSTKVVFLRDISAINISKFIAILPGAKLVSLGIDPMPKESMDLLINALPGLGIEKLYLRELSVEITNAVIDKMQNCPGIFELGLWQIQADSMRYLINHMPPAIKKINLNQMSDKSLEMLYQALVNNTLTIAIEYNPTMSPEWQMKFTMENYRQRVRVAFNTLSININSYSKVFTDVSEVVNRKGEKELRLKKFLAIPPIVCDSLEKQYQDSLDLAEYIREASNLKSEKSKKNVGVQPIKVDDQWRDANCFRKDDGTVVIKETLPRNLEDFPVGTVFVRSKSLVTAKLNFFPN